MIVIASTRPGRVGLPVARWFTERATEHGAFEIQVVDLAELDLPFLDEPRHPRLRQYTQDHTHAWSEMVDAADAFVFVTSEYNHGYPAPLKNAIDDLNQEWKDKPLGFVSYGGVSAGTRARCSSWGRSSPRSSSIRWPKRSTSRSSPSSSRTGSCAQTR
jgi:NAD(P)H-dependent FMN reductase